MNKKILSNSAWLFFAQGIVKVIAFFYTIFLARSLGIDGFGFYVTALAYFSLISSFADFGFNRYLIREGAKNPDKLPDFIRSTALTRLSTTTLLLIIFAFWLTFFDQNITRTNLSILAVLAVLPQAVSFTFDAALIARQNLRLSALSILGLSLTTTFTGVLLISKGYGVFGGVLALIFGQLVYMAILYFMLSLARVPLFKGVSGESIKAVLKGSLPYGILGILGLLYFRIDTLMISYIKGVEQAGLYGAAYRFLEALIFIPSALATAMFPVLAKLHDNDIKRVKEMYFSALKILGFLSLPIVLGYYLILPTVIQTLLPDYLPSIQAVLILALAIPFIFLHVPGALVLISSERFLKSVIILSVFTLSFNIITNLIFIPSFGFIGAAYTTVASEILSFVVFFILLYQKVLKHA
ncbi:flippase [Candidatus Parcubacteria bacterium]|nr:MAG: flippase [Candidatus Parcubacteria bacterium]